MISFVEVSTADDALAKYRLDFGVTPTPRRLTAVKENGVDIEVCSFPSNDKNTVQYYHTRKKQVLVVIKYDDFSPSVLLLTEREHAEKYEFVFGPNSVKFIR